MTHSIKPMMEQLEDRVLFDAVPDAPVSLNSTPAAAEVATALPTSSAVGIAAPCLVLVDPSIELSLEQLNQLVTAQGFSQFEIHLLSDEVGGISQVSELLKVRPAVDEACAQHVLLVTQMNGAGFRLGNEWLDQASLVEQGPRLASWGNLLGSGHQLSMLVVSDGQVSKGLNSATADLLESLKHWTGRDVSATPQLTNQLPSPSNSAIAFQTRTATELIVIDSSVRNSDELLAELTRTGRAEVLRLNPNEDGVQQIVAALQGRQGMTALHLISHGSEGSLSLGGSTLNRDSMLGSHRTALQAIGAALDPEGDILIYGCDFTSGANGLQAAMVLGGLTGADIAASSNSTGWAARSGDWILESNLGSIETAALVAAGWQGLLSAPTVNAPINLETLEDIPLVIAGSQAISVNSSAAASLTVTLTVNSGTLTLASLRGITFVDGTQNGQSVLEFQGSIADLNVALNGLRYTPALNYFGADRLVISATDGEATTDRGVDVTIVSQNDSPVIVVNPVNPLRNGTPSETSPHTFSVADFHAVDPDNSNNQLTFVLNSLPTVGELRLNGFPVLVGTIFSQTQLGQGALQYIHNGGENHSDFFSLTVNDGAGGSHGPVVIPLSITPVNDPLAASTRVVVYEGGSTSAPSPAPGKPVPTFQLNLVDPETDPKWVTLLSLPEGGELRFAGTRVTADDIINGFTISAADFSLLEFIHDGVDDLGTRPSDRSFAIRIADEGGGTTAIQSVDLTVNIQVISVNDELELQQYDESWNLLAPGGAYILGLSDIRLSDADGPVGQITFTLENTPLRGTLRVNGQGIGAGGTFTQAQLAAGQVVFHHDRSQGGSGLETLNFTARDGSISILTDQLGALREGDHTTPLRVLRLNFELAPTPPGPGASIEVDLLEGGLHAFTNFTTGDSVTVNAVPIYGQLLRNGVPLSAGDSFVVNAGDVISYQHSGVHLDHDAFWLNVNGSVLPGQARILLVNDAPMLTIAQPLTTVYEGQSQVIDGNWLVATDEETISPQELIYTIIGYPTQGQILVDGNPVRAFGTFSHQDILNGRVSYRHNGSESHLDQLVLSLSDGALSVTRSLGIQAIPVNDQPEILRSFMQLFEGELRRFTSADLAVQDRDGGNSSPPIAADQPLQIRVDTLPTRGTLWYQDPHLGMITVGVGFVFDVANLERFFYQHDSSENFGDLFNFTLIDNNTYATPYDAPGTRSGTMNLEIIPVNDPPSVSVNTGLVNDAQGDRRVYEGGLRVLTPEVLFSVDPDSTNEQVQYRIITAPTNGQLLLNGSAIGVGSAFTQLDLIAGRVAYRHHGSETTADQFVFRIDDAASNVSSSVFSIGIIAVNDTPQIQAPAAVVVNTADYHFSGARGISLQDFDSAAGSLRVTLSVTDPGGQLRVTSAAGLAVTGTNTPTLTLTGSLANLNAALATLRYRATDLDGPATLTIHVTDQGNSGVDPALVPSGEVPGLVNTGGSDFEEATRVISLLVSPVNDTPTLIAPGPQQLLEDTTLIFQGSAGNQISIGDADQFGEVLEMRLVASQGTLTLSRTTNLTFSVGNGIDNAAMIFRGTLADINSALDGLRYRAGNNFNGSATLSATVSDLGNTGDGGAQQATRTIPLTVVAINDAPTVAAAGGIVLVNGPTAVTGFAINDIDYADGGDPASTAGERDFLQVMVRILPISGSVPLTAVQHANVVIRSANNSSGVTIDSTLTGNGSALAIRGTRGQVNAYLAGLTIEFTGAFANIDQQFRVQVVADDRLRDRASGILDGSGLANGGPNSNGGNGSTSVPTTAIPPYGAVPSNLTSNVAVNTRLLMASGVNNAPSFSGMGTTVTFTEGSELATGTPVVLTSAGAVTDPELSILNNWQNANLRIHRVGGAQSTDLFGLTGSGNSGVNFSGNTIRTNTTVLGTFTQVNGELSITITRSGTTTAQVNSILRAITYANTSHVPPTQVAIQFTISDGDTDPDRAANPQGVGGLRTATDFINVNIVSVNDTPRITGVNNVVVTEDSGPRVLASTAVPFDHELTTFRGGAGDWGHARLSLVRQGGASSQDLFFGSGLVGTLSDGGPLTLSGVRIGTVTQNRGGLLAVTFDEGTTTAQVQAVMRSIAYANTQQSLTSGQTQAFNLVWTLSDGDTDPDRPNTPQGRGGSLSGTAVQTVTLQGVNDAPAARDFARTINQDTSYVFRESDFGFWEPVDAPGNRLLNVVISALPTQGVLMLQGEAVVEGQAISVSSINAGHLVWIPWPGQGGPDYAEFLFQVQDDGGTAMGGSDVSLVPNRGLFHVNLAPQVVEKVPDQQHWDSDAISWDISRFFADPEGHSFRFSVTNLPPGLSLDSRTGVISGVLDSSASAAGPYAVEITVTDQLGAATSVQLEWVVLNWAPTATDDRSSVDQNNSLSGNVLDNDHDPDFDPLAVVAVAGDSRFVGRAIEGSQGGRFVVQRDGSFVFEPGSDFVDLQVGESRVTTVRYLIQDIDGLTAEAEIAIEVHGLNDRPTDGNETIFVTEDEPVSGNLLGNSADLDGDRLTVDSFEIEGHAGPFPLGIPVELPGIGALIIRADGSFSFSPDPNFNGFIPAISYTVTDGQGGEIASRLQLVMIPVNDDPRDDDERIEVQEDQAATGNVLSNAGDVDGDRLHVLEFSVAGFPGPLVLGQPVNWPGIGVFRLNADGEFNFAPAPNYDGPIPVVTYTVADQFGGRDHSTLTLVMVPVNDPPELDLNGPTIPRVIANDRNTFENALTNRSGSSIIDDRNSFATDPPAAPGSANSNANNVASLVRAGYVNGEFFSYTIFDVNVALQPTGALLRDPHGNLIPGGDILSLDTLAIETPVRQGAAQGQGSWGIDSRGGHNGSRNGILLDFTHTPGQTGIGHFGIELHDFESGTQPGRQPAEFRVYRQGVLIDSGTIDFGGSDGNDGTHFWGYSVDDPRQFFDQILLIVGDDDVSGDGTGFSESWGADRITFGQAYREVTEGVDFSTTFVEGGPGVSISSPRVTIDDLDDLEMDSAHVVLRNAQLGDRLNLGSLPAGITGVVDESTPGVIRISLSGSASRSAYEAAIHGIQFSNTSELPSEVLRVIEVTVNDGELESNTAVTLVRVIEVNDAPVAVDDIFSTDQDSVVVGNVTPLQSGQDFDADGAFTVTHVNGQAIVSGIPFTLPSGARLTLQANGTFSYDPRGQFRELGSTEVFTDSFEYTITDERGAQASARATVVVQGLDDEPTLTGFHDGVLPDTDGTVFESGWSGGTNPGSGAVHSGAFTFLPGDSVREFSVNGVVLLAPPSPGNPVVIQGSFGVLRLLAYDAMTGEVSYEFELTLPGNELEITTEAFRIVVEDRDGDQFVRNLAFAIIDDAPLALDDSQQVTEDTVTTIQGNVIANDRMGADSLAEPIIGVWWGARVGVVGSELPGEFGTLTLQADGSYRYELANEQETVQRLGAGESLVEVFTYQITDADGDVSTATLTIAIVGINDSPDSRSIPEHFSADGEQVTQDFSRYFSDRDRHDQLTFSVGGTLPPGLTLDSQTGVIHGEIAAGASTAGPYSITLVATDSHGATVSQSFVWHVTNPNPVAENDDVSTTQNNLISGSVLENDLDVDGDFLVVQDVNGLSGNLGRPVAGSQGGTFVIHRDGRFYFDPGQDFVGLAAGESRSTVVSYTVSDEQGGTSTAFVTVTVWGENDAPVSSAIPEQTHEDSHTLVWDVSGFFWDLDLSDRLVFSDNGTLPPGLSLDPQRGVISGSLHSSASVGGPYSVTITATDTQGAEASRTFTWNVLNLGPVAENDQYELSGASPATAVGNALRNDSDPDGDRLSIVPQSNLVGSQGGLFSFAADGTITFDPNGDFDHVHVTDSRTTTVEYKLVDADGATTTATISITVVGVNNTPIARDDHHELLGANVSGNAFGNDVDPEGQGLTGTVIVRPSHGVVHWQPNGSFVYTPGATFVSSDQFTYRVVDIHGASSTAVVHISRPFAWDSLRDFSNVRAGIFEQPGWERREVVFLSQRLEQIASEPILAGYARPGAWLVGRIYGADGSVLAETNCQVNAAGNWVMQFAGLRATGPVHVVIEHVISDETTGEDLHGFRLTPDTYRAFQMGVNHHQSLAASSILSDAPSTSLLDWHRQNYNPLRML